ncbi:MAG: hypothetical protein JKY48_00960 [Flavobacteriales bacterium]|nr:hypothetical protein [Flavobacteriales bacterium]
MENKRIRKRFPILLLTAIILIVQGCGDVEIRNLEDMAVWMYQEENGLQKVKKIGTLKLQVNYIPPAYHALREDPQKFSTLVKEYDQSLSFMISISGEKGENILWRGLKDYAGYRNRIHHLNFELEQFIELRSGDVTINPVLSNVENLYEETDHLRINIVFTREELQNLSSENEVSLHLDDRVFKTGLNVFRFKTKEIENIPTPILAS